MALIDEIRKDARRFTSEDKDFAEPVDLVSPDGDTATVNCRTTKHYLSVDSEGQPARSRTVTATFSEDELLSVNGSYPVRNASDEVHMKDHKATITDHRGTADTYKVVQSYPDEYLGIIVLILQRYETP